MAEKKKNSFEDNQNEEFKDNLKEELEAAEKEANKEANKDSKASEEVKESTEKEDQEETPQDTIEKLQALIAQEKDRYLRLSAEFDNYRKRTLKEKADLILNGGEKSISSILPVIDDFERAIQSMEKATDVAAVKEGVDLIYDKLMKTLEKQGVKVIETKGQALDTDFHEAVTLFPAPSEDLKGKIIDCVQTGYTLNDKVIRHAKVVVGE